eukprot:PhM_4_TR18048/c0_g1_i3/m.97218
MSHHQAPRGSASWSADIDDILHTLHNKYKINGGSSGTQNPSQQTPPHPQQQQQQHHLHHPAALEENSFVRHIYCLKEGLYFIENMIDVERGKRDGQYKELVILRDEVNELRQRQQHYELDEQRKNRTVFELHEMMANNNNNNYNNNNDKKKSTSVELVEEKLTALSERVLELECGTAKTRKLFDDRTSKLERHVEEMVSTCVEEEMEKIRSVARDAARSAIDALFTARCREMSTLDEERHGAFDALLKDTMSRVEELRAEVHNNHMATNRDMALFRNKMESTMEKDLKRAQNATETISKLERQYGAEVSNVHSEITTMERKITQMSAQLAELRPMIETIETNASEADRIARRAESGVEGVVVQSKHLSGDVSSLRTTVKSVQDEVSTLLKHWESNLKTQSNELNAKFGVLDAQMRSAVKELVEVRSESNSALSKVEDALRQTNQLQTDIDDGLKGLEKLSLKLIGDVKREVGEQIMQVKEDAEQQIKEQHISHRQAISDVSSSMSNRIDKLESALHTLDVDLKQNITNSVQHVKKELSSMVKENVTTATAAITEEIKVDVVEPLHQMLRNRIESVSATVKRDVLDATTSLIEKANSVSNGGLKKSIEETRLVVVQQCQKHVSHEIEMCEEKFNETLRTSLHSQRTELAALIESIKIDLGKRHNTALEKEVEEMRGAVNETHTIFDKKIETVASSYRDGLQKVLSEMASKASSWDVKLSDAIQQQRASITHEMESLATTSVTTATTNVQTQIKQFVLNTISEKISDSEVAFQTQLQNVNKKIDRVEVQLSDQIEDARASLHTKLIKSQQQSTLSQAEEERKETLPPSTVITALRRELEEVHRTLASHAGQLTNLNGSLTRLTSASECQHQTILSRVEQIEHTKKNDLSIKNSVAALEHRLEGCEDALAHVQTSLSIDFTPRKQVRSVMSSAVCTADDETEATKKKDEEFAQNLSELLHRIEALERKCDADTKVTAAAAAAAADDDDDDRITQIEGFVVRSSDALRVLDDRLCHWEQTFSNRLSKSEAIIAQNVTYCHEKVAEFLDNDKVGTEGVNNILERLEKAEEFAVQSGDALNVLDTNISELSDRLVGVEQYMDTSSELFSVLDGRVNEIRNVVFLSPEEEARMAHTTEENIDDDNERNEH